GGEGGTGKSQVIKAITCSLKIMERLQELALLAPTGAAADNIDGSTIHSALGMKVEGSFQRANRETTKVSKRIQALQSIWSQKSILIIDEISMVDQAWLGRINRQCAFLRQQEGFTTQIFGGLSIVILMGDFFQFPPVNHGAKPLWKKNNDIMNEEGKMVWERFNNVIML